MDNLRNKLKKINMNGELHFNEPMSGHTTFKTGGPADIFVKPAGPGELNAVLNAVKTSGEPELPLFILGGGANLLVADEGIRGIVIDMGNIDDISTGADGLLICGAGATVDAAAEAAYSASLSGMDSFYGMPGTIGGGIWMNARCYGRSFSDILKSVTFINDAGVLKTIETSPEDFGYKQSPFQQMQSVIVEAAFRLEQANAEQIRTCMKNNREDREKKGHYAAPCAGSVFKNNRAFGDPSGTIIDSLGLRGKKIGGAAISDQHANIIINCGNAKSIDIYELINYTRAEVLDAYGWELEPEIQLIGNFSKPL